MTKNLYLNLLFSMLILMIGFYYANEFKGIWIRILMSLVSFVLASLLFIGFKLKKIPAKTNQSLKPILVFPVIMGIIGIILINCFMTFWSLKLRNIHVDILSPVTDFPKLIVTLLISILIEEIYFRRLVAQKIYNEKTFLNALCLSAVTFSIAHFFSNTGLVSAFFMGLFLGYIYLKTKSLSLSIFIHLSYNMIALYTSNQINSNSYLFDSTIILSLISLGVIFVLLMIFLIEKLISKQIMRIEPAGNSRHD